jgi:subtilisin family serine protease
MPTRSVRAARLFVAFASPTIASLAIADDHTFVPGRMFVRYDTARADDAARAEDLVYRVALPSREQRFGLLPGLALIDVTPGTEVILKEVLGGGRMPGILWADVEGVGRLTQSGCVDPFPPEDPFVPDQWWIEAIRLDEVWSQQEFDLPEVVVAVIDTGVNYLHPDLADRMWVNLDEIPNNGLDDDANNTPDDVYGAAFASVGGDGSACSSTACSQPHGQSCACDPGPGDPMDAKHSYANGDAGRPACGQPVPPEHGGWHGTAIASVIAGLPNDRDVRGFGCNIRIMGVRLFHWCEQGQFTESEYLGAILYAAENGARVISNSAVLLAGGSAIQDSILEALLSLDVLFVTSAGNANANVDDPNDPRVLFPQRPNSANVLAVGATTENDTQWTESNFGATIVDVMAPGVRIRTFDDNTASEGTGWVSGTSFAAPMVAAAAAMYRAKYPTAGAQQTASAVRSTARPVPALANTCFSGGVLDVYELLGY